MNPARLFYKNPNKGTIKFYLPTTIILTCIIILFFTNPDKKDFGIYLKEYLNQQNFERDLFISLLKLDGWQGVADDATMNCRRVNYVFFSYYAYTPGFPLNTTFKFLGIAGLFFQLKGGIVESGKKSTDDQAAH